MPKQKKKIVIVI